MASSSHQPRFNQLHVAFLSETHSHTNFSFPSLNLIIGVFVGKTTIFMVINHEKNFRTIVAEHLYSDESLKNVIEIYNLYMRQSSYFKWFEQIVEGVGGVKRLRW
ncbi:transmembrane protein, putative [Medicago truncatula]|uniref:Transmembrane protein, putative n=1 Tax=Medicago truncatula TaxID=3880 RepID=A0A072UH28_MEDTR|nr:transmembrane protein, putative [Medicago truncatula]